MKNYIFRYGLLGAGLSILFGLMNWFLLAEAFGVVASQAIGYVSVVLALMCIPMGIRYFRDKLNSGVVSFGQAFKIGTGITLVTSLVMFFYGALFFVFQGKEFQQWTQKGLSPGELEQVQVQMAQMPPFAITPWFQGIIMFLMVFLIGLIINLISSLILKR